MAGDDFAYYLQKVPGAYYLLGTNNPSKGITSNNHSPTFDVDESVLYTGAKVLKEAALEILNKCE